MISLHVEMKPNYLKNSKKQDMIFFLGVNFLTKEKKILDLAT